MTDIPTPTTEPKRRGRKPGARAVKRSPLHENYDSDRITLALGVDVRADLARRARLAGMTPNQYIIELLQKEREHIFMRPEVMQRLQRNAAGCTVSAYAEYLCTDGMNNRGEF